MTTRRSAAFALFIWLAAGGMVSGASAQDALGAGADFSDDWDAILNLMPPSAAPSGRSAMAATDTGKRARSTREDEREARGAAGFGRATGEVEPAEERRGTRQARDEERVASDGKRRAERGATREGDAAKERPVKRAKQEPMEVPGYAPGGYEGLAASWHAPWPEQDAQMLAKAAATAPALSLHPVGRQQIPYVLIPQGPDGGFDDGQVAVASKAFGSWDGGPRVSARLLDLIYHAAKHFDVYHVHLVSGVRHDRSGSRHSHGLAADIVLPGVDDDELAAYFRPQGFCGVGIYTRAGFVHIDVRERSYFWLDKSPPGKRMRIIPVRGDEAKAADEAAMARGQTGYVNPPRLQKALHARAKRRMEQATLSQ